MDTFYTLGHGTLQSDAFANTLRAAGVSVAADIRRFPGSRRNPQFGAPEMTRWLRAAGIVYRPTPELGGRREADPDSRNTLLRNKSFRGYADYMATPPFRAAFDALIEQARAVPTAAFCAETLWWTCHRRLVADAVVLLAGMDVIHLTPATRSAHVLTPGVRREGDSLVYVAGMTLL